MLHCLHIQHEYVYYHPPTKLWEGNVVSLVCLSVCPHVTTHVWIGSSLFTWGQPPLYLPWLHRPVKIFSLEDLPWPRFPWTCLNFLTCPQAPVPAPPDLFKLFHYVAHTSIGKRAVSPRLKDLVPLKVCISGLDSFMNIYISKDILFRYQM